VLDSSPYLYSILDQIVFKSKKKNKNNYRAQPRNIYSYHIILIVVVVVVVVVVAVLLLIWPLVIRCFQSSLLHYFLHTREESFFAAIRNRMHLSALAIKERSDSLLIFEHSIAFHVKLEIRLQDCSSLKSTFYLYFSIVNKFTIILEICVICVCGA